MTTSLPCVLMRSGTSRGPFFLRDWLPKDDHLRDRVLQSAIGAADASQINGLGGGSTLTSKVAMVSRSSRVDCDVDYLFAQVGPNGVDTRPNCGNMLAGVAPFAVEQGLIAAADGMTSVRVHNVNTGARIDVQILTPNGRVVYDGNISMDGVAGTAAPVYLSFLDAWGAVTGQLFPTGERINVIDGVEVTCIDAAMPMVLMNARSLGVTGTESASELDAMPDLLARMERIRLQAGRLMGLGRCLSQCDAQTCAGQSKSRPHGDRVALFHALAVPYRPCRHRRHRCGDCVCSTWHGGQPDGVP